MAEKDENVAVNKVSVTGNVKNAGDNTAFSGASVYLLH